MFLCCLYGKCDLNVQVVSKLLIAKRDQFFVKDNHNFTLVEAAQGRIQDFLKGGSNPSRGVRLLHFT